MGRPKVAPQEKEYLAKSHAFRQLSGVGVTPSSCKIADKQFWTEFRERIGEVVKEKNKEELVRMFVKVPKSKREMIYNVVAKSSYNNASELIRAGIDKELNLQMYKDNMDVIIKELSKLIDIYEK